MTPHKQLIDHDPNKGRYGDCGRTAIACLLDLNPSEVPHFYDQGRCGRDADEIKWPWLAERGLFEINVYFDGATAYGVILEHVSALNPGLHFMLTGKSATGCNHTVICKDGKIVHDPSPENPGIISPCIEDGMWWISFIGKKL